jgi:hypothetical protein
MAQHKKKPNDQNVEAFLNGITDDKKRQDSFTILEIMKQATQAEPKMWGSSIIGFGSSHYKYASGQEADWFLTGFSPRKQNLTLYLAGGLEQYDELLQKLGKHKTGKACLYIKRIDDIDLPTLKKLIQQSVNHMRQAG